uniref:Plant heme peroxidase family profile domain-containing protein n=1 Tax=Aegilops tauschii subsp. strangulata TaxID=200361 RepID=A0A453GB93_AEGTS
MATGSSVVVLAVLATVAALVSPAMSLPVFTGDVGVSPGFHAASCPQLDGIVRSSVEAALQREVALAAGLLRLYFHDCFPQGCDASILLNTTSARETALLPNLTIRPRAMQLIESIRARVRCVMRRHHPARHPPQHRRVRRALVLRAAGQPRQPRPGVTGEGVPPPVAPDGQRGQAAGVLPHPGPRRRGRPRGALRRAHHRAVALRQLRGPVPARGRHLLAEAGGQLQQAPGPAAEPGRDHPRPVRQRVLQGAAVQPGRAHLRHGARQE